MWCSNADRRDGRHPGVPGDVAGGPLPRADGLHQPLPAQCPRGGGRPHEGVLRRYVLNLRLNSNVPMVVLGENLCSRQVALVSGHEKLQSDMGVTY